MQIAMKNEPKKEEVIFLKSKRVVLRPIERADVPKFLVWINDPEVTQYIATLFPKMEADENEWFEGLHKRQPDDIVLGIVVDGKLIGNMGIHHINWINGTATTGAIIGDKEYWGKGYGSEAKMLLLHYLFHTLNLRKISSSVIAYNDRSYAYSMKCGYKEEGRRKAQLYRKGQYWDEILLAVFRKDWEPAWERFEANGLSFK